MSDTDKLKEAVHNYDKAVKEKREQVREAADRIRTARQVKTEIPTRQS